MSASPTSRAREAPAASAPQSGSAGGPNWAPGADAVARRRAGAWARFARNRRAVVGALIILAFTALAILAPQVAPYPPEVQDLLQRYLPPTPQHWMGTDGFGRDVWSRALWAGRVTLAIAVVSVLLSVVVAVAVGALAGYYRGLVDSALTRLTEAMMAIPTLFFMIAIVGAFGSHIPLLIAVLGLTAWPVGARIVRGEVLALRGRDYVEAARALGAGDGRILLRHILPNALAVVIVSATIRVAVNILLEAGLSYLGLGVQPPLASWGNMVSDGKAVLRTAWWVSAFSGAFIFLTVMAFNLLGDGLRDAFDPRMRDPRTHGD
jgi:peptide/nickel transport system permease protein